MPHFAPPWSTKMPLFAPYPTKSKTIPVSKKEDQEILKKKILALRAKQTVTIHLTLPNFLISVEIRL